MSLSSLFFFLSSGFFPPSHLSSLGRTTFDAFVYRFQQSNPSAGWAQVGTGKKKVTLTNPIRIFDGDKQIAQVFVSRFSPSAAHVIAPVTVRHTFSLPPSCTQIEDGVPGVVENGRSFHRGPGL